MASNCPSTSGSGVDDGPVRRDGCGPMPNVPQRQRIVGDGLAKNASEGLGAADMIVPSTLLLVFGQVLPVVLVGISIRRSSAVALPAMAAMVCSYYPPPCGRGAISPASPCGAAPPSRDPDLPGDPMVVSAASGVEAAEPLEGEDIRQSGNVEDRRDCVVLNPVMLKKELAQQASVAQARLLRRSPEHRFDRSAPSGLPLELPSDGSRILPEPSCPGLPWGS